MTNVQQLPETGLMASKILYLHTLYFDPLRYHNRYMFTTFMMLQTLLGSYSDKSILSFVIKSSIKYSDPTFLMPENPILF